MQGNNEEIADSGAAPCYYNHAQELFDPSATAPEELEAARDWGEKSDMGPLPEGAFCNLAKGWEGGEAAEWPNDGSGWLDGA